MRTNPFELLTDDPLELSLITTKAKLVRIAIEEIRMKGWNQKQTAEFLEISQPRVSNLFKSQLDKFSLDTLFTIVARLGGYLPEVTFRPGDDLRPISIELKKAEL